MVARGRLRVYLGAAPGVGKTYAMLAEGQRRRGRGTDVVIGLVEPHGRRLTTRMAEGLETVSRRTMVYRGLECTEMDLDAVLARRPQVALVDELAHTNVPGCRNEKRWQDVEELLDAGIDVVSTLNIQHLLSLADVVQEITGVRQTETIPDEVVRRAEQVELVDMTPEALRRRMVHGNVYPPDRVEVALTHYFRPGNLTALRELALLWVADRVEEGLRRYRAEHGILAPWETKERIVVALSGTRDEEALIRRAVRIAGRIPGSDLLAVHVSRDDGRVGADPAVLAGHRALVESLGGSYHRVADEDVAEALLRFARAENATQIVLGGAYRPLHELLGDRVVARVTRHAGGLDVHVLTHERAKRVEVPALPPLTGGLGRNRFGWGLLLTAVLLPLLTVFLTTVRGFGLAGVLLVYLLAVVGIALVGGVYPALAGALVAGVLADYLFVRPVHSLTVARVGDASVLVAFVVVAATVSAAVERSARRARRHARASAEAGTLADLATSALRDRDDLPALLERVRVNFALEALSLLQRDGAESRRWFVTASSGPRPPERPEQADTEVAVTDELMLAARGRPLDADDRRLLHGCAAQVAATWESRRSRRQAEALGERAVADRYRAEALRAAASDLEAEVTAAQGALERLRERRTPVTATQWAALCDRSQQAVRRIGALVGDLLDLSRVHAGALDVHLRPVDMDEVMAVALGDLGPGGHTLTLEMTEDLPDVIADATVLTRVVTDLAAHALRRSPDGEPPDVAVRTADGRVEVRVTDHGPLDVEAREAVGAPVPVTGLVPRLCADLVQLIGGELRWDATAGGGVTAVLSLPAAAGSAAGRAAD
ncbi:sensor histidine kinase [Streptomyces sp. 1-11]|nr:sensor histidine kinase [Streptomyces sp. 1-11]